MKKKCKIRIYHFVLVGLLLTGCASTRNLDIKTKLTNNLQSCVGKLTTTDLLMFASSPTEKNIVSDGEIWIYKYRKSKTTTTTTGNGGLLFPYESESKTSDYLHFDIRLRFNNKNILTTFSYDGHYTSFDYPFLRHTCQ